MNKKEKARNFVVEYATLTLASVIVVIGVYFFKFPNNFTFGGVAGISVVLSQFVSLSASSLNFILNMILLVVGFLFLGKGFATKTVYVTVFTSVAISVLDKVYPMTKPLTDEPVLELIFAIVLPAAASAILFNIGASSGGTDIVAMIVKRHSPYNIGMTLMIIDLIVTISALFVFDIKTGLFSLCGLMAKTLVIDGVIENINLCKYFTIICSDSKPIVEFINVNLRRSATLSKAEGAYSHEEKTIIFTVVNRAQALQLRNFIREREPDAFMMITNSSEIIGKGFRKEI